MKKGFTLIEIMVAMAVTSIIIAAMALIMTSFAKSYRVYLASSFSQYETKNVMSIVDRQYEQAGYFLARPRDNSVNGLIGSSPINIDDLSDNNVKVYGNMFDNYSLVTQVDSNKLVITKSPALTNNFRTITTWKDVDNYQKGSLVEIYTGERATEASRASAVWRIDTVNSSDNTISVGEEYGDGEAFYALNSGDTIVANEVLEREIVGPKDETSVYVTISPQSPRIPLTETAAELRYEGIEGVNGYINNVNPTTGFPNNFSEFSFTYHFAEKSYEEFTQYYPMVQSAEYGNNYMAIDTNGDTDKKDASLVRRNSSSIVFINRNAINPSFYYSISQVRLEQIKFYCARIGTCN